MKKILEKLINKIYEENISDLSEIQEKKDITDIKELILKYLIIKDIYKNDLTISIENFEDSVYSDWKQDIKDYLNEVLRVSITIDPNEIHNINVSKDTTIDIYMSLKNLYPHITIEYLYLYCHFYKEVNDSYYNKFMNDLYVADDACKFIDYKISEHDKFIELYIVNSWNAGGIDKTENEKNTLEYKSFISYIEFIRDMLKFKRYISRLSFYAISIKLIMIIRKSEIIITCIKNRINKRIMLSLINEKHENYYDKHGTKFNSIPRNIDEVSFASYNNILNKDPYMSTRTNFNGYFQFCALKIFGRKYFSRDPEDGWCKCSHTTIYNRQYSETNDTKFGVLNDFIIGSFLYNYILKVNKYKGNKMMVVWPLSGFRKKEKKHIVVNENKIYKDKEFPNLLPRDSERLTIILSIIGNPISQIKFLDKFYETNFGELNSYSLVDWARNKKYINDGWLMNKSTYSKKIHNKKYRY